MPEKKRGDLRNPMIIRYSLFMGFLRKLSLRFAWFGLGLICLGAFQMMLWAARTDAAIDDELAHIPAGYGYVHNLDYRLNPEHPPLIKALALLPVLFLNPTFPTQIDTWQNQINAQWDMGHQFLYASGNDADSIIRTARIVPILITIFAIVVLYIIARRIMGAWWALLPAFLFAFDPTILAQGHYVTNDVGAAAGILFALYGFLRLQGDSTKKNIWIAGAALGIAELAKFSAALLIPLFVFLEIALWIRECLNNPQATNQGSRFKKILNLGLHRFVELISIIAIGYIFVVYPVYALFTLHYPIAKQVSDTIFLLSSYSGGAAPTGHLCHINRCLADGTIWMAKNPITRPFAEYLLGVLMVIQRSAGGNTIYFMGHITNSGGPWYFPIIYLAKEPIPTLGIVIIALLVSLWKFAKNLKKTTWSSVKRLIGETDAEFAKFGMMSFMVLYWGVSIHTPLNIGIRHIIPIIPFAAILSTAVWKKWITNIDPAHMAHASVQAMMKGKSLLTALGKAFLWPTLKAFALFALLLWVGIETLSGAPYFLSYYNEFAGGTWNGYRYATDSNYDWGQDLLRLRDFVGQHPDIDKIAVDYFGGGDAHYTLGNKETNWWSSHGNPANQNIHWLAVSIEYLESATQPLAKDAERNASDTYAWLVALRPPAPGMGNVPQPDYRVGTTIFVYKL